MYEGRAAERSIDIHTHVIDVSYAYMYAYTYIIRTYTCIYTYIYTHIYIRVYVLIYHSYIRIQVRGHADGGRAAA